jgi:hypothetical protein
VSVFVDLVLTNIWELGVRPAAALQDCSELGVCVTMFSLFLRVLVLAGSMQLAGAYDLQPHCTRSAPQIWLCVVRRWC